MSSRTARIFDMLPKNDETTNNGENTQVELTDQSSEKYEPEISPKNNCDNEKTLPSIVSENQSPYSDNFQNIDDDRLLCAKKQLFGAPSISLDQGSLSSTIEKHFFPSANNGLNYESSSSHAGTSDYTKKPPSELEKGGKQFTVQEKDPDTPIILSRVKVTRGLQRHVSAETSEGNASSDVTSTFSDFDSDDSVKDPNYQEQGEEENIEDEDENIENEGRPKEKSRKRKSVPKIWKKNKNKRRRYLGLEHTTEKSKKVVKKKRVKPPCPISCKLKCGENIPEEDRKKIHRQYWTDRKSIDMKRQFIASHVQQIPVIRRRERNYDRELKRRHTNRYSLEHDGKQVVVCKKFFLNTLSISQQTVDTAIEKKREGGLLSPDKRGKHEPSNKIPVEVRNTIREHIAIFRAYESHYSRERSQKKYLGNHLNITRMFKLYLEYHENNIPEKNIGKEWLYADVFNYEFNFAFKNPDVDTCDECDKYRIKMQEAGSQDLRSSIQEEYENHLKDASERYKMKAADKQNSKETRTEKVVMIDLQKCLPTPELHNSKSFYSLKLWTYNLVIHDSTDEKAYCMMWDESIAGRG